MCEFPRVLGWKPQTKMGPYCKIYKKAILAHEFWGDNQYFQSLRPRTAFQWHRACYFLWCTILALGGGAQFSFGGAQAVIWGARPRNAPVAPGLWRTPAPVSLASSIPFLGLEKVCPRKGCPWPWPQNFFVSLTMASSLVASTPPLIHTVY